ncbi:MAG: hypothetical protein K2X66_01900, partial [Cyanobacteria bacterium]|nr:hypothetical protein [Cyanobacteriota bacterium]
MTSSRNKIAASCFYKHALALSLAVFPLVLGLGLFQVADATPDIYWFRAHGKNIGTVSIESFVQKASGVQNPAFASDEIVTVVENKNRMNRLGNDFTSGSKSRFVEKITDGTPVQFTHSFHLSDQPTSESKGQVEPGKIHMEVTQYDTQLSESTPIQDASFSFPTGEKIKRVFQAHYNDPVGSQFQFQTLHLALAPHVVESFAKVEAEETLTLPNGEKKKVRRYSLLPTSENKIKSNGMGAQSTPVLEWRD